MYFEIQYLGGGARGNILLQECILGSTFILIIEILPDRKMGKLCQIKFDHVTVFRIDCFV